MTHALCETWGEEAAADNAGETVTFTAAASFPPLNASESVIPRPHSGKRRKRKDDVVFDKRTRMDNRVCTTQCHPITGGDERKWIDLMIIAKYVIVNAVRNLENSTFEKKLNRLKLIL